MIVLAVVLWIVSERLPIGRYIYAIGANEKAAALNGIPVRAYVIGVFVGSGLIAGFAGCVLAAKLRIGQANVGLDYLLPALVGAFLGSTTIKPGRVNVWGTMVGVLILAVGISGIQQLGGAFFVEPLFNGTTLVVAIALAGFAQRRRSVTVSKAAKPVPPAGDAFSAQGSRAIQKLPMRGRRRRCRNSRAAAGLTGLGRRCWPPPRSARAAEDAYLTEAKADIAKVDAAGRALDRPDDRPEGQGHKLVIYVSPDHRNGGAHRRRRRRAGSGESHRLGLPHHRWPGFGAQHTSAMNQAIALKPGRHHPRHGRCQGAGAAGKQAVNLGIKVVGWHSAGEPGPVKDPPVITNITTEPTEVGKAGGAVRGGGFQRNCRSRSDRRQPLRDQHGQD